MTPLMGRTQNLVPNPSFEEYNDLPCGYFANGDVFSYVVKDWVSPTEASPDLFAYGNDLEVCPNNPFSNTTVTIANQAPKDGFAMAGLVNLWDVLVARTYREYIQVKLNEELIPGKNYHIGFYSNLADVSLIASDNLAIYFSQTPIKSDTNSILEVSPQIVFEKPITDKDNWVFLSRKYMPSEPQEYLTIGNFSNYENTKIINVDSTFSNEAKAFSDVVYYFVDSVFVEPINDLTIPNVFTPNGDNHNQAFYIQGLQENRWILTVVNRWGQQVYQSTYYHNQWHGEGLSPGVYYYYLKHRYVNIEYKGSVTILK